MARRFPGSPWLRGDASRVREVGVGARGKLIAQFERPGRRQHTILQITLTGTLTSHDSHPCRDEPLQIRAVPLGWGNVGLQLGAVQGLHHPLQDCAHVGRAARELFV